MYTGVWDVAKKTYASDGIRGFYRGLLPSLAKVCSEEFSCQLLPLTLYKVVPAVSISYVVYEQTKKQYVTLGSCILFVQMQTYHSPLVLQAWRLNTSTFRSFVIDGPVVLPPRSFPLLYRPPEYRARCRILYQSIFTHVLMIPFCCGCLVDS